MRRHAFGERVINTIVENDKYIKMLADNLMLDELLCGECDSVEFLKAQIKMAFVEHRKEVLIEISKRRMSNLEEWSKS